MKKQPDKVTGSWSDWHSENTPLRLGVSSCLLGNEVRYDAGHSRNAFVVEELGRWVEWVPVCPEVEIGMTIPRPTIQLESAGTEIRLVSPSTGKDFTQQMSSFARKRVRALKKNGLDGYIVKSRSPSCGMKRVRVYGVKNVKRRNGVGRFTEVLMHAWPTLPVEEEGRLNDADIRENFIERMFCRNRWRSLTDKGRSRRRLVEFHTAHKLLLRAHNEAGYRRLGRIVDSAGLIGDRRLYNEYEQQFFETLKTPATQKKHRNVLSHAQGYLNRILDPAEKREIVRAIDGYATGLLPLIVPLTVLRFNIRKHGVDYLEGQLYFDPHPKELMLRNHA